MMNARSILACSVLSLIGCAEPAPTAEPSTPTPNRQLKIDGEPGGPAPSPAQVYRDTVPFDENGPRYTWTITPAPNGTFGFAIYDKGKLYIDQQKATGLAGPDGWKSKIDARTAVMAAIEQLEKGQTPEGLNIVGQ